MSETKPNYNCPCIHPSQCNGSCIPETKGNEAAVLPWQEQEAAELRAELHLMKTAGIIEVAVRNPSVADYMAHWEGRALAAEARAQAAEQRVKDAVKVLHEFERYVAMNAYDQWMPEGHAKTSVLSRHLDAVRAFIKEAGE